MTQTAGYRENIVDILAVLVDILAPFCSFSKLREKRNAIDHS